MSSPPTGTVVDGTKVLVCDDDEGMRELLCSLLREGGYQPVEASSGEEAIELAGLEHPAIVLLDLLMPGLSGWETAATLRASPETAPIPIVIVSVLAADPLDPAPTGVAGWIRKPLDERSLFEVLDRAVESDFAGARVLIVEDDDDLAVVVRSMLERHGVSTFRARTGEDAIDLGERLDPDVLVLDLGLPGVDGFAVVDWLRGHDRLRDVALIVYTARDLGPADRDRLRLGSRTVFLTKGRVTLEHLEQGAMRLLDQLLSKRKQVRSDGG